MADTNHRANTRPIRTLIDVALEHAHGDDVKAGQLLSETFARQRLNRTLAFVERKWLAELTSRMHDWAVREWGHELETYVWEQMIIELSITRILLDRVDLTLDQANEILKDELRAESYDPNEVEARLGSRAPG